jgi:1,4-alpha-glucan branching enzyme
VQTWVRDLNRLYQSHAALYGKDDSWDGFQWLNVLDKENSVFAFRRTDGETHLVCVYNFTPAAHEAYEVALPSAGSLTLLLSSDDPSYGGAVRKDGDDRDDREVRDVKAMERATAKAVPLNGQPYAATLALPPLSALFYEYTIVT